jgi:hypothetical protein
MPYEQLIKIATISSMSVSPLPWLQLTMGSFGERLSIFVAVRPAAATTLTGRRHRMTLPSYSLLNTRICIPACHITVTTWTLFIVVLIAICFPADLLRIVWFRPKKLVLPSTNSSPAKMTVVSDCLLITSLTQVLTCSFTSLCCFPHF